MVTVLFGILFVILLLGIVHLVRNEAVYQYRRRVIDAIYKREDWRVQRLLLEEVPYSRMVWQFWRPLRSFGLHHFLQEGQE